ncbi:MAG: PHP domain-containing protein [Euzebyaceae bacterium]|nr:PHP domain-containing protein [Euzebyaceae bacterium]
MSFDLHTHTVFSDGTTSPEDNAAMAASAGLAGLAATDHDTTAGWERAAEACERHDIELVPGL